MNYWLFKSEPNDYSIEDLARDGEAIWDGVRNYQARNFLRQMEEGDLAFFYHSNIKPPGIVGLAKVARSGEIDPTQFDPNSKYFDPKATPESPRWQTVAIAFVEKFPHPLELSVLKARFSTDELLLVRRGNRLSVMPVGEKVAEEILEIFRG
ncbi:EVE domain-containing protein [Lusitaniella coriacea LEGE 07157]|uniref:EVE domain-containing protein n=1 Tax=Lusitaniella coriacea LEGE 07157 TaxID=945747 RepID=A0A8J7AXP0_9CYAN|nr:EVE domain-containing protein [Lusitaniella coriacea]MBE9114614.1 EVE domain-containing protein [Lusitaniella coriacea LEGE 07157]